MPTIPAIILAGGRAMRMGGGDKPLRLVAGVSLLDRVIARLAPQCGHVVLNANGDPARFQALGLPIVADADDERMGPLAGVLAGLDWAAGRGATQIVTAAADTPFLPSDLVVRLQAGAGVTGLCIAASPDANGKLRRHPTFGLWPVALREELRAALMDGLRKVTVFTDRMGAGQAVWPSTPFDPFFNVNTPDDMTRAEDFAQHDAVAPLHQR